MTYSLYKVAEAEVKQQAPAEQTPAGQTPAPAASEKPSAFSKAWGKTKQIGKDIGSDTWGFISNNAGTIGVAGLAGALAAIPGSKRDKLERLLTGLATGFGVLGAGLYAKSKNYWK